MTDAWTICSLSFLRSLFPLFLPVYFPFSSLTVSLPSLPPSFPHPPISTFPSFSTSSLILSSPLAAPFFPCLFPSSYFLPIVFFPLLVQLSFFSSPPPSLLSYSRPAPFILSFPPSFPLFLYATTHPYKRLCLSVVLSIHPSVSVSKYNRTSKIEVCEIEVRFALSTLT